MSEKSSQSRRNFMEELGITEEDILNIPDELKGDMTKLVTNSIGKTFDFDKIIKKGVEYALCPIQSIPLEALTAENAPIPPSMNQFIKSAKYSFTGAVTKEGMDNKDFEYIVVLDDENRLGIKVFNSSVTEENIKNLVNHLLITGLESHRLIKSVLHKGNFVMPEGVQIIALGLGVTVITGDDGSYLVDVSLPDNVISVAGRPSKDLKESMPGVEVDHAEVCESNGKPGCTCSICQLKDMAMSKSAQKGGDIH